MFVRFQVEALDAVFQALLDTGAAYSFVDREVAENAGIDPAAGDRQTIMTRLGRVDGALVRARLRLVADAGDSIEIDSAIFVPDEGAWPPDANVLGYDGCLDHIRLALDPQRKEFYFGPSEGP